MKQKRTEYNEYPDTETTTSTNETTGMMPTPPENDAEMESYQDLSGMAIPKKKK